jgi:hypothetical protein
MSWLGPIYKRKDGEQQSCIPLGPFHIRLPFIHYRFEVADFAQGLIMCAVCLGIIIMSKPPALPGDSQSLTFPGV